MRRHILPDWPIHAADCRCGACRRSRAHPLAKGARSFAKGLLVLGGVAVLVIYAIAMIFGGDGKGSR